MVDRVPVRRDLESVEPYGAPQLDVPVRLNTNETPWPPPAEFVERLAERLTAVALHRYPDRRAWALRQRIADRAGLDPARVWVANGSNEVLLQLFQAYGGPGRHLLLFRPGYSAHPLIARVALTEVVEAELDPALRLDAQIAAEAVRRLAPDLVCVASPNNPTGIPVPLDAIRALHDAGDALVIVDEAYVEFAGPGASAAALLDELPRLVICRTFSKAWRLAGIRLGYLLAHDWVVDDLRKVRLPYHLDTITQAAGALAVELEPRMTDHVEALVGERERLRAGMAELGVEVFESAANFLLFRTAVGDLFDRLLGGGVLVRDFSSLPRLDGCLRVSVGTPGENDLFLSALAAALGRTPTPALREA